MPTEQHTYVQRLSLSPDVQGALRAPGGRSKGQHCRGFTAVRKTNPNQDELVTKLRTAWRQHGSETQALTGKTSLWSGWEVSVLCPLPLSYVVAGRGEPGGAQGRNC